jgi:hypothetical protein
MVKPNSITIKTPNEKGFKYAKRKGMGMSSRNGGHLYMQTNEVENAIIPYRRSANIMAVLSPDGEFLIVGTTSSSEQPASQPRSTMAGRLDGVSGR